MPAAPRGRAGCSTEVIEGECDPARTPAPRSIASRAGMRRARANAASSRASTLTRYPAPGARLPKPDGAREEGIVRRFAASARQTERRANEKLEKRKSVRARPRRAHGPWETS